MTDRASHWINSYIMWWAVLFALSAGMLLTCIHVFHVNPYEGYNLIVAIIFATFFAFITAQSLPAHERRRRYWGERDRDTANRAINRFSSHIQFTHFAQFIREREDGLLLYFNAHGMEEQAANLSNLRSFLDNIERASQWSPVDQPETSSVRAASL